MTRKLFPQFSPSHFPDPRTYDFPEWILIGDYFYHAADVVTFGTPLTLETVAEAYRKGIFPWYMSGVPLPWYCPQQRAILEFDDLHIGRSLRKEQRKQPYSITIDDDFRSVIEHCSETKRRDQAGTWITDEFIEVYCGLFGSGMAHSVEARDGTGKIVGGLYGVDAGGVFCGESMFYHAPNASKLALLFLIEHLESRGATWLDVQVMTAHMETLGATEIPREEFLNKLAETQKRDLQLFSDPI